MKKGKVEGNVFIHVTMSLDGLISRPGDELGWAFHFGTDHMVDEVMEEIGAVVLGNRGFKEGTMKENRLPYGHGESALFCRHPSGPRTSHHRRIDLYLSLQRHPTRHRIEAARNAAGDKRSASSARALINN